MMKKIYLIILVFLSNEIKAQEIVTTDSCRYNLNFYPAIVEVISADFIDNIIESKNMDAPFDSIRIEKKIINAALLGQNPYSDIYFDPIILDTIKIKDKQLFIDLLQSDYRYVFNQNDNTINIAGAYRIKKKWANYFGKVKSYISIITIYNDNKIFLQVGIIQNMKKDK